MDSGSRIALYVFTALCVGVYVVAGADVSLALGSSVSGRLSYVFVHANIFHLIANAAAINAIARSRFRLPLSHIAFAYVIAASAPYMEPHRVVGASAIVYAIFGIISWQAASKRRFHAIVAAFLALGFIFKSSANATHIYCYLFGITFGYASQPPSPQRPRRSSQPPSPPRSRRASTSTNVH